MTRFLNRCVTVLQECSSVCPLFPFWPAVLYPPQTFAFIKQPSSLAAGGDLKPRLLFVLLFCGWPALLSCLMLPNGWVSHIHPSSVSYAAARQLSQTWYLQEMEDEGKQHCVKDSGTGYHRVAPLTDSDPGAKSSGFVPERKLVVVWSIISGIPSFQDSSDIQTLRPLWGEQFGNTEANRDYPLRPL